MPRVCINKTYYKASSIGGWIVGQFYKKKIKRKVLADELGITPQGLTWKLLNNSFSYSDMLTVFEILGSTDEEICFVMKP